MKAVRDKLPGPATAADAPNEPQIAARLDRLPATGYIWRLVALISFGAFFSGRFSRFTTSLSRGR